MEIDKITVSVGITRNMGNYESLRLDYAITVKVLPEESWQKTIDAAKTACNLKLTKDIEGEIEWFKMGGSRGR